MPTIGILMIERDQRVAAVAVALDCRAIDRDDVQFAVIVAINQAHPATHGFDNIFLVRRRDMWDGEASFLSDVLELRDWGGLRLRLGRCSLR